MKALKNILNKLYSEDNGVFAVLKTENKLELAAIDDLDSAVDQAEVVSREQYQNVISDSRDFILKLSDFKQEAKEYLSKYEYIDEFYSEFKIKIDVLEARLNAYEELSNELGIDPNNSETYNYGDLLLLDMQNEYREYDSNLDLIDASINASSRIE
tara:strand:- start:1116 stop:1583 length:468 start_codon:yes stop_codon:yes gene_type:complete